MTGNGRTTTLFPAGVNEPDGNDDASADVWALARLALAGGGLESARLVRWRALADALGAGWRDRGPAIVGGLRREIGSRLPPGGACVRYDDFSYLAVAPPPAAGRFFADLDGDFCARVCAALWDASGAPGLIEVWLPVGLESDGLVCERIAPPDVAGRITPASREAPAESSRLILGDAQFHYYPLWDVRGNTVFCYLCEALWDTGAGGARAEDDLAGQFDDPKRVLTLDLETFTKATDELDRGLDRYRLASLLIPVHYQTLADPAAADTYVRYCNRKIWSVREFAYFEIVKPPPAVSEGELAAAAEQIQPYGAGVLLRAGRGFDRFDRVPAGGILSVGLDLRFDRRPDRDIIADLRALGSGAGERGLKSHVHGLTAMNVTVAAASAGVDYIGGEAIGLDEWTPDEPEIRPIDLFKSLLASAGARQKKNRD